MVSIDGPLLLRTTRQKKGATDLIWRSYAVKIRCAQLLGWTWQLVAKSRACELGD